VPALAKVIDQDFRGGRKPANPLRLFGSDAEQVSKPDETGWRITLPVERTTTDPVGVVTLEPVRGNFSLTTSYQILQAEPPTTGHGVGFELYVMLNTPARDAFGFYRASRVTEGEIYQVARTSDTPHGRRTANEFFAAAGTAGQLRVTRQGSGFTFAVKEDDAADFRELARYDLGPADLNSIRLAAYTGREKYALDLCIRELKVNADGHLTEPATAPPAYPRSRTWLLAGALAMLLMVVASLAAWLVLRRRHRHLGQALPAVASRQAGMPAPPDGRTLTCPGCDSPLKLKAAVAGKKVKCPRCGQAVSVPSR
jgi:hypothetical protein